MLPQKSRVSTIFTALVVLGVGSTAFGLYVTLNLMYESLNAYMKQLSFLCNVHYVA